MQRIKNQAVRRSYCLWVQICLLSFSFHQRLKKDSAMPSLFPFGLNSYIIPQLINSPLLNSR